MVLKVCLIAFLFISANCFSQGSAIKGDALGLLRGNYGLDYEYAFSRLIAVQVKLEWGTYATGDSYRGTDKAYRLTGVAVLPEFRYYPFSFNRPAPRGFFAGTSFRYMQFREKYHDKSFGIGYPSINKGTIVNVGIDAGYKFNYERISLELMLGIGSGIIKHDSEFSRDPILSVYSQVLKDEERFYRAEISVGYLFSFQKSDEK